MALITRIVLNLTSLLLPDQTVQIRTEPMYVPGLNSVKGP